jgi:hypothetical protein
VRERTGLVLDPYFSGTKIEWLLRNRDIPIDDDLAIGTIDTWLLWKLTGGAVHATDPSNASRTMLFDIASLTWSTEMCDLLGVPMHALPEVRPSSGRFGLTSGDDGIAAGIGVFRPEWSESWAFTTDASWADPEFLEVTIPNTFSEGYAEGTRWSDALAVFDAADPHRVMANSFHDRFMPQQ